MKPRLQTVLFGAGLPLALVILLSPLLALALPGTWKRHVYHEIAFQILARTLPDAHRPEDAVREAMDYTRRHLWLMDNPRPYSGRSFDYLIEGIGWCDYHTKVFCNLLAAKGIHCRYAFLKDAQGNSPHTIAEVYVRGRWRAVDPFFHVIYMNRAGEWATLEELTPELVAEQQEVKLLASTTTELDENILQISQKTFPPPIPPQRSDDFVKDRSLFDDITDLYVRLFGQPFANWYQDRILEQELAGTTDPADRLWHQARQYHLFRRLEQAEPIYRQLLAQHLGGQKYRERVVLFLARLLLREKRFEEARGILKGFAADERNATKPWPNFQLALCYEGLGQTAEAQQYFERYRQLHGKKFAVEALKHLAKLPGNPPRIR